MAFGLVLAALVNVLFAPNNPILCKWSRIIAGLAGLSISLPNIIVLVSFRQFLGPGAFFPLPAAILLLVFAVFFYNSSEKMGVIEYWRQCGTKAEDPGPDNT